MTTAAQSKSASAAVRDPRRQWILLGISLVLLPTSLYFIWKHFQGPSVEVRTVAGRPLLTRDSNEFHDADVGIRFTPPPKWSMQARTTEAPGDPRPDRLLVKYKRLLPKQPAAWFRVHIVDESVEKDLVECVAKRDPGPFFTSKGSVEKTTVAGIAAAKVQYGGKYNGFPSIREITGVRRGSQVFYFVSTFQTGDREAQALTRQAMNTVLFEQR